MKKKILIVLSIFLLAFFLSGLYIIITIENTTSSLDRLIQLHQIEILRERLLIHIERVQADIGLKGTPHARSTDNILTNLRNMDNMAGTCFDCHHSGEVRERLNDLSNHVKRYKEAVSMALTVRSNPSMSETEEASAFRIGNSLITKVNNMITMTSNKLELKTQSTIREIEKTKRMLSILIITGTLLTAGMAFLFLRSMIKPVNLILEATRRVKGGDLGYRIEGLRDEFGEVATSFNEMGKSLKEYMQKIEESEKRYRLLFEKAGDAIFILDAEGENAGKIVAANQAAAEMYGYTIDELLSLRITDLDTPEAAKEAPARINRVRKGEWIKAEINHLKKDGTVFPVEISAGLLEVGDKKYILAIDRDITERKLAEETLQRAEQMKIVGELAAGLAHEIKNPLAGIKASMEVLSEEANFSEEDRNVLLKVINEIRRIESLLKELLNFARPPKPRFSITDINTILDKAMTLSLQNDHLSSNELKRIKIVKDLDSLIPQTMADPMQMQQVFLNILLNASEAMPEGGTLTVKTAYDELLNSIKIKISDTGRGIDEEMIDKIFKPFFTTKPKGTGLGLSISKRLIEQHRGSISVENNSGGGATFMIDLPVRYVEVQAI
ncbi:MAG: ATP-binding protein [Nitrospirota bacterium]